MTTSSKPLADRIAQFAPVRLAVNLGHLPPCEARALSHIVSAARVMDGIFLEQAFARNASLLLRLLEDGSAEGQAALRYFLINKGPFDRLDDMRPFLPAVAAPAGRGTATPRNSFYPVDATRDEIERWVSKLDADARRDATGFYTVIRRDTHGRLTAIPYSVAYQPALFAAAAELRLAAAATKQPTLNAFLLARADAFLSNDYYDSDIAWMELDSSIEPTIGPYETYEDTWFGYKAAFEAVVAVRDDRETEKLATFGTHLQALEDALPIDPRFRNPSLGALAPIRVVNVLLTAGDANRGVQSAAFNLPNDDRIIRQKGAKRVMLKNVQEAKFTRVLLPIASVALSAADRGRVSFDAFFTHILMHELMHGLGPHQVASSEEPVRLALKDTYAPIEEAKADVSGLWALQRLADAGAIPAAVARDMYVTFLASTFRSIRFGITEAHGRGIALQLNTFLDDGAVVVGGDGSFAIVEERIRDSVARLTSMVMTIQANGDYQAAAALIGRLGVVRPEVQRVLDRLEHVPIDIAPIFQTADALEREPVAGAAGF